MEPMLGEIRVGLKMAWEHHVEEGTFWDEHWVLYGNQYDNKLHILKKKENKLRVTGKEEGWVKWVTG